MAKNRKDKDRGFDPFGGMFDFNRDGKTDLGEQWIAYKIFEDCTREEDEQENQHSYDAYFQKYGWRDICEDGLEYGIDPDDYETEEEYEEALNEAKYGWRDTCEDGSDHGLDPNSFETEEAYEEALEEAKYGWRNTCEDGAEYDLCPDDYETEEEYEEALNEAKYGWRDTCEDGLDYGVIPECYETLGEYADALRTAKKENSGNGGITLSFEVIAPGLDELDSIVPEDFPNLRKYNAARDLCALRTGYVYYAEEEDEERDIRRWEFILGNPDLLAANYLTHEGDFLYVQAIKEHFTLPFEIEDEDEERIHDISVILDQIAKTDGSYAMEMWKWCFDHFHPYRQYGSPDCIREVVYIFRDMPQSFVNAFVDCISSAEDMMRACVTTCDDSTFIARLLVSRFLQKGDSELAQRVFKAYLNGSISTGGNIVNIVDGVIHDCERNNNRQGLMLLRKSIFPLIEKKKSNAIRRSMPGWKSKLAQIN